MSFIHPALLWILPLAAVPILLHLLTLHRLKTVELSTFRFLFDSYVQQRRRMRFLEALLAVLRMLFLLFLIFLFTRPVLQHWDGLFRAAGTGGREVILLVDCSASMNARSGGTAAIDRAKSAAASVLDRLGRDDRLTLVRVGSRPEEVLSKFNTDTRGIRDALDALQATSSRGNVFAALLQLFGPEAARRTNPLVYLFTDCQVSGWREVKDQGLDRLVPAGTPFVVVDVGSREEVPNVAVVGDAPRAARVLVGQPVTWRPRVVNFSKKENADVTLSVLVDDKEVARTQVALKPGQTLVPKLPPYPAPREPGVHRVRFEVAGRTPDRFPDDDRFLFTLAVVPRVKVLLVGGAASDPLDPEGRYLATALTTVPDEAAAGKAAGPFQGSREFLRSLDVREVPEAGVTAEALRDASLVVLANCGSLDPTRFELLRGFVSGGGGLLVFPGDKVNAQQYSEQFFPVPGPQGETLTGAVLGPPEGDPEKVETFQALGELDTRHPSLAAFDDPDGEGRYFKSVRVYRHFKVTLAAKKGRRRNAWPLASFGDGSAALVESRLGDGVVVLAAFPAHPRWSNLPVKPEFVPLVLRLAGYAARRPEVDVPAAVVADAAAEVAVNAAWAPAELTIKDPAGRSLPQALERAGARLLGAFERTAERGYYTVEVRGGPNRTATRAFAVNLDPLESDFTTLGEKDVRTLLPAADLTWVDASAEAQLAGPVGKEQEVWPLLIWLVFAVIGVEFFLATLGGARRGVDDDATVGERVRRLSPGVWVGRMTGAGKGE